MENINEGWKTMENIYNTLLEEPVAAADTDTKWEAFSQGATVVCSASQTELLLTEAKNIQAENEDILGDLKIFDIYMQNVVHSPLSTQVALVLQETTAAMVSCPHWTPQCFSRTKRAEKDLKKMSLKIKLKKRQKPL